MVSVVGAGMYVCMYGHHIKQGMGQLGKVDNRPRGQLNRENGYFPSPFAPENLVSRDGLGCPVPRQHAYSPHSGGICLLTEFLPISAAASIHLFMPPNAIESVPNLSGYAIACRWYSLPRVRRYRASSSQGSSRNECCFCITMDQLMCASLFPHPPLV